MKSIAKFLVLFLLLIALVTGSFFLIFGQGLIGGLLWAIFFTLLCGLLFTAGIAGIMKGKVDFFKIRNTGEAIGVLLFSIFLFTSVSVIAAANSFVEFETGETDLRYEEKLLFLASAAFQMPLQENLLSVEKNGVTYYHIEANKSEIEKMDLLLMDQREELNAFFGTQDTGGLAIEFHENYETMEKYAGMEGVSGFYNMLNRTIHLVPDDPIWDAVLQHEYVHYQSHLFAIENGLSVSRIPHWFEEGVAEYFAESSNYWFDLESFKVVDFRSLDKIDDFKDAVTDDFDPYAQSYLVVEALVEDHGEKVILELLGSKTAEEFYGLFEATTGQGIEEFQQTYMSDLLAEQQLMEENFERINQAMATKNYGEAEKLLLTVKSNGDKYDIEEAYWIMSDMYLQHGLLEKAYVLLENKVAQKDSIYIIEDLLMMAEIQLLENPEKALQLVLKAEKEAGKEGETDYYEFDVLIFGYQKAALIDRADGYRTLLEKDLIYNGFIREKLKSKLEKEGSAQY